jgi:hypothetical protein
VGECVIDPVLELGPRVTVLPVVHGSGDFAWEVRRLMELHEFDCLAVPLPGEFQAAVEQDSSVPADHFGNLREQLPFASQWQSDEAQQEKAVLSLNYVPIDPCQPVIAALRTAMGERIARRFVDLSTRVFVPHARILPDAYALKFVSIPQYASAVLPFLQAPKNEQWRARVAEMAWQLRQLSVDFERILFVCGITEWPWIREAFFNRELSRPVEENVAEPELHSVNPETLDFLLGELPFVTELV